MRTGYYHRNVPLAGKREIKLNALAEGLLGKQGKNKILEENNTQK